MSDATEKAAETANQPPAEAAGGSTDDGKGSQEAAVDLNAAREEGRAQAATIVDLCALAGFPAKAGDFLAKGMSEPEVREALQSLKADADGAGTSAHHNAGMDGGGQPKLNARDIYARRNAKTGR